MLININSELEYVLLTRVLRELRLLKKDEPKYQDECNYISKLVYEYQQNNWDKPIEDISDEQIKENDEAEYLLEILTKRNKPKSISEFMKDNGINDNDEFIGNIIH